MASVKVTVRVRPFNSRCVVTRQRGLCERQQLAAAVLWWLLCRSKVESIALPEHVVQFCAAIDSRYGVTMHHCRSFTTPGLAWSPVPHCQREAVFFSLAMFTSMWTIIIERYCPCSTSDSALLPCLLSQADKAFHST